MRRLIFGVPLWVAVVSAHAQSPAGVWKSEGWASVYQIQGFDLRSFEVTTTTCVESKPARLLNTARSDGMARFRSTDGKVLTISPGQDEGHRRLQFREALVAITLTRLPQLPDVCQRPTENTPLGNFDVFTQTFAENYIAFDKRHMDWQARTLQLRSEITLDTAKPKLFAVLEDLIRPLGDIHTSI